MAQAVATTIYRKSIESHNTGSGTAAFVKSKVKDLEKMLWGGTLMLIVDHIINGELTWKYPFFTALTDAGGASVFLRELLTVGVPMSLAITAIWGIWALISERRTAKA